MSLIRRHITITQHTSSKIGFSIKKIGDLHPLVQLNALEVRLCFGQRGEKRTSGGLPSGIERTENMRNSYAVSDLVSQILA